MKLPSRQYFHLLVIGLLTLTVSGCFTYTAQKKFSKASNSIPYDAIIVPGVPFENGKWSRIMKARVYWAVHLYNTGIARNIIFSGSAVYTPYNEAQIMAMYAEKLGVKPENIILEKFAEHSAENLFYGYRLAVKTGFRNIAFASDPFQSKAMENFAYKFDLPVDFIPAVFPVLDSIALSDPEIEAEKAFVENFVPIEQREKFFKRIGGTLGKNIRFDIYEEK